ncbi:AAA family ATPase [Halomonas cupida]|uniref:AAA family ATPase n=1 Tax=Halomonas cupida TaxID=44933 RepID=UPI003A91F72B
MPIYGQVLKSLHVDSLKSMRDLKISFEGNLVTAILGPNGNGKSTILHALACAFKPVDELGEDYKFSNFFLPHPDALWQGSYLTIKYSYKDGQDFYENIAKTYQKKLNSDRWSPRYVNRPERNVVYIGIDACVPLIESEKKQVKMTYSTSQVNEKVIDKVLEKASYVLNRQYAAYNIHDAGNGKKFFGVEVKGVRYSALSMSAGEQKVFSILEKVFKASKYSLILVDEIDLLLHDMALRKLIDVISERAESKSLQVVFTTHRETVTDIKGVNVRHVFNTGNKTLCFEDTKPDSIARLTGVQEKTIEIFVEDDLARAVVRKVASQLGIGRHVSISLYGAASNCFVTVGGFLLGQVDSEHSLFVLDGDVYTKEDEIMGRLNKVITGTDQRAEKLRSEAREKIIKLRLPAGIGPEEHLNKLVLSLGDELEGEAQEIHTIAQGVVAVNDGHQFVNDVIERLGLEREVGLSKIVDVASGANDWDNYVKEVKEWIEAVKPIVEEVVVAEAMPVYPVNIEK